MSEQEKPDLYTYTFKADTAALDDAIKQLIRDYEAKYTNVIIHGINFERDTQKYGLDENIKVSLTVVL